MECEVMIVCLSSVSSNKGRESGQMSFQKEFTLKVHDRLCIDDNIIIEVRHASANRASLGCDAPPDKVIYRAECSHKRRRQNTK